MLLAFRLYATFFLLSIIQSLWGLPLPPIGTSLGQIQTSCSSPMVWILQTEKHLEICSFPVGETIWIAKELVMYPYYGLNCLAENKLLNLFSFEKGGGEIHSPCFSVQGLSSATPQFLVLRSIVIITLPSLLGVLAGRTTPCGQKLYFGRYILARCLLSTLWPISFLMLKFLLSSFNERLQWYVATISPQLLQGLYFSASSLGGRKTPLLLCAVAHFRDHIRWS